MATTLADKLSAIRDEHMKPLLEKREKAAAELAAIEKEINAANQDLQKALQQVVGGPALKKSSPKKSSKPAADDKKCIGLLEKVISQNKGIEVKEAIALVTDKLKEGGFNTQGQYTRLKSFLDKGSQFAVENGKCSMAMANA